LPLFGKVAHKQINPALRWIPRYLHETPFSAQRPEASDQDNIKNGCWPESLDALKSSAPAEAFIDPVNNGSFIYKTTKDSFVLYSKGENNLDENGKRDKWSFQDEGPDDWLFWPAIRYEAKKEKTNDEQQ
jgi:hypothetical protein